MTDAIIMLTLNDMTLADAPDVFDRLKETPIKNFGFKDVGLPFEEMKELAKKIKEAGKTLFFEIVSPTEEETVKGAERALLLGADFLIGGKYVEAVLPLVEGKAIKYFPYVGEIVGHPCNLEGTAGDMIQEANRYKELGVDGINLLAYRYNKNPENLLSQIKSSCDLPLLVAGSVNSQQQIDFLSGITVEFFTMGTALFDGELAVGEDLETQLRTLEGFLC